LHRPDTGRRPVGRTGGRAREAPRTAVAAARVDPSA
jgi:hypothetical protein